MGEWFLLIYQELWRQTLQTGVTSVGNNGVMINVITINAVTDGVTFFSNR